MSKKRDFGEPFKVKIIKDTWKPSTPWYIVDAVDDKKIHATGFKTKKSARELVENLIGVKLEK